MTQLDRFLCYYWGEDREVSWILLVLKPGLFRLGPGNICSEVAGSSFAEGGGIDADIAVYDEDGAVI